MAEGGEPLPWLIEVEKRVIEQFVSQADWPHELVLMTVLDSLAPLAQQAQQLPTELPEGVETLADRVVVNVYDSADLSRCHLFINRPLMMQKGYWENAHRMQALLAHEHAHPLSENRTTHSSRQLRSQVNFVLEDAAEELKGTPLWDKASCSLRDMLRTLSLYAPRELFANMMCLIAGIDEPLFALDQYHVRELVQSLEERETMQRRLRSSGDKGVSSDESVELLLLLADMESCLPLALEIVPFWRSGKEDYARALEASLEGDFFPHLGPEISSLYEHLCECYYRLQGDLNTDRFKGWMTQVLRPLADELVERDLIIRYEFTT